MIVLILISLFLNRIQSYTIQGRFGHSAVLVNDSIYFYGGDSSVSASSNISSEWISELSILPIHSPYSVIDPPWKPASGPQDTIGGPPVFSHIAFLGGSYNGNMIIIGGVMPQTEHYLSDEEPLAFSYDCDLGRWNSFSLPSGNNLNREGAASTTTKNGITYIWGGKRPVSKAPSKPSSNTSRPALSTDIYRFDSIDPSNSYTVSPQGKQNPPLRYAHTQTLLSDHKIVILGGFDGATGDAISLSDVWVYDINSSNWDHIQAKLDIENKPANRSSHSQVLMPDGFSILVYGGYDGYHVYNDVAVLDTRTWTWSVKNTNAAVQGRADHTATLVGTNMIVAFGFSGVSTSLTIMSDIEVLDTTTWSWTSVYIPSPGYDIGGDGGKLNGIGGTNQNHNNNSTGSSSPSIAIVAGAVTGGLVVFVLILVAIYIINIQYQKQKHKDTKSEGSDLSSISIDIQRTSDRSRTDQEVKFNDPPSSAEPFEYDIEEPSSSSRRPSKQTPHPLHINTTNLPKRSDTATTKNSSVKLVPSPWTPLKTTSLDDPSLASPISPISTSSFDFFADESTEWMIRRAASSPTHRQPMPPLATISKPDDKFYPLLKRAATVSEATIHKNETTSSSSSSTIIRPTDPSNHSTSSSSNESDETAKVARNSDGQVMYNDNNSMSTITSFKTCNNQIDTEQVIDDNESLFDRQEFILHSDEVAKVEEHL